MIKLPSNIIFVVLCVIGYSCDPSHKGILYIKNSSSDTLLLRYATTHKRTDTVSETIYPNNEFTYNFSGIGKAKSYNCCPCEFPFLQIKVKNPLKTCTKNITNTDSWVLDKSEIKKGKNKNIKCVLQIEQSDIQ